MEMRAVITKAFGEKKVFEDFKIEIEEGKITCILGPSGVGKSTLLNIFASLTTYTGEIIDLPEKVAYVFQEPRLIPYLTARENLRYAFGESVKEEEIEEILQKIELTDFENRKAGVLSGGEKRRVAIARAFLSDAPLLLMDEPFSSLDTALKIRLIHVFAKLWSVRPRTTVLVTHDLEEALMLADRIVVLKDGKIAGDHALKRTEFPTPYGLSTLKREEILAELLTDLEK